jgi:hypothetical protein
MLANNERVENGTGAAERRGAEKSEEARKAAAPVPVAEKRPKPEVRPRAQRRSFTTTYKPKSMNQADAAGKVGAIAALLRREGHCASGHTHWSQEGNAGVKQGPTTGPPWHQTGHRRLCKGDPTITPAEPTVSRSTTLAEMILDVQNDWLSSWA